MSIFRVTSTHDFFWNQSKDDTKYALGVLCFYKFHAATSLGDRCDCTFIASRVSAASCGDVMIAAGNSIVCFEQEWNNLNKKWTKRKLPERLAAWKIAGRNKADTQMRMSTDCRSSSARWRVAAMAVKLSDMNDMSNLNSCLYLVGRLNLPIYG